MPTSFNRRQFLTTTALASAATGVSAAPAVRRGTPRPVVISSGNGLIAKNGGALSCVETAFQKIMAGEDVLDSLISTPRSDSHVDSGVQAV